MCYNVYSDSESITEKRQSEDKTMKKYFVVEIEEDMTAELTGRYIVESSEIMCAESEEEIINDLEAELGKHLVTYAIRRATWKERRAYKKSHRVPCLDM